MTKEQAIKSFKKYIIFQESTLNDYYKMDEEFYKDQIEQLELSTTLLETVLSILEEQDKTIDLMANHIATSDSNLCEYLDITTKCQYYAGENKKLCDDCIKQYFGNKAKELLNK